MKRSLRPRRQDGQVLVLLLAWMFLGGSALICVGMFGIGRSIDEIQDRVGQVVGDQARRQSANQVLDAWRRDGESFLEAGAERRKQLFRKLEDHATRPEGLRALFAELQQENHKAQAQALGYRFGLRDVLTREEWAQVFAR